MESSKSVIETVTDSNFLLYFHQISILDHFISHTKGEMSPTRATNSSIFEAFSLSPLPYPVLLVLALIFFFLGFQWYSSYEEAIEATEESFNWVLLITPLLLLFAVKWLSNVENPEKFLGFGLSPWERRRWQAYQSPEEGSSPWGVAALIVLVLILMQFHSTFLESWF